MALSDPVIPLNPVSIAYKEWAGICRALGDGAQSILLRKGGIAEGPGGFVPEHAEFWLYPTHLHEHQQGLRPPYDRAVEGGSMTHVPISSLARVEAFHYLDKIESLDRLGSSHFWTEETIHQRFHYRKPGLWLIEVRIFSLPTPYLLPITPEYAGCKTWVKLEEAIETRELRSVHVRDDLIHARTPLAEENCEQKG